MTAAPTKERLRELRVQFKQAFKHLDTTERTDCWEQPTFLHEHVESIWCGWKGHAAFGASQQAAHEQALPELPKGYVLVKAYSECGKYTDDNPGLRADCARKLERGQPCERCPSRAAQSSQPLPVLDEREAAVIGQLYQHGETGRTRVVLRDQVADCDARWIKVGDLVLAGQAQQPAQAVSPILTEDQTSALADYLKSIGWKDSGDAQWTRLMHSGRKLRELLAV